jgi:hypothetical protein
VQRLLGKELLVLLWAVELTDVKPEEIAVATRNWLGLKPEERWWLYTMTAAATGLAHQHGLGWRGALRQALCFGTRADTFHLGTVAGRGTLEPKVNEGFAGRKRKSTKSKPKNSDDPSFLFTTPVRPDPHGAWFIREGPVLQPRQECIRQFTVVSDFGNKRIDGYAPC